jgi:hypothetical protein
MRTLIKTLRWVTACAAAFASTSGLPIASAAVLDVPSVQVSVNGQQVQLQGDITSEEPGIWAGFPTGSSDAWSISGFAAFGTDPFIDYSFDVQNKTAGILSFEFLLTTPFVGGPYTRLVNSHGSSVDDDPANPPDIGKVTIGLNGAPFIQTTQINGVDIPLSGMSSGCAVPGTPGFAGADCFAHLDTPGISVVTGPTGTLGILLAFTLSPHDTYHAGGAAVLSLPVPEPRASFALTAGCLLLLAVFARRRRH